MQAETFAKAVAVWDGANALLHDELAERNRHIEDLIAWAKSLEADLVARTEALAAWDAELARTSQALANKRGLREVASGRPCRQNRSPRRRVRI